MNETPQPSEPTSNIMSGELKPIPPEAGDAPEAEELDSDQLTAWDEPAESTGHRVPRVRMEDEESIPMKLVEQGIAAADEALRGEG